MTVESRRTVGRLTAAISPREWRWLGALVAVELVALALYFALTSAEPTTLRYVLYPFVWIDVGVLAVARARPSGAGGGRRVLAATVATAYLAVLVTLGGLAGTTTSSELLGLRVGMRSPGWGPAVTYVASTFFVRFVPFLVVGYLSLSYLLYVTVLDATRSAILGVPGIAACVGCSLPVIGPAVAGLTGGSVALTAAYGYSLDLSTVAFVLAAVLLHWRPTLGE